MKTLITGATGFVGGHLTQYLLDKGLDIKILARNESKVDSKVKDHIEVIKGDVTDLESVTKALKNVEQVFHLAGVVGYSKSQYQLMHDVNVTGTHNLISAMKSNNVSKLLHFSSVVAIGASFTADPLNEQSPYNIRDLNLGYFNTKKDAEDAVLNAYKKKWIEPKIVNPSTIYGYGDAQKGSRGVQLKVAKGKFPFYTPGGVSIVAIEDVLKGTWATFEKGRVGERYILSGENILIKDLFHIISNLADQSPPSIPLSKTVLTLLGGLGDLLEKINLKGPLNSETAWTSQLYHWFDSTKAQTELDFSFMPAHQAIANSVRWIREQLD